MSGSKTCCLLQLAKKTKTKKTQLHVTGGGETTQQQQHKKQKHPDYAYAGCPDFSRHPCLRGFHNTITVTVQSHAPIQSLKMQ